MAILPIVTYNDPILLERTESVKENSDELQELIDDMFETMYNAAGVGLAAPQIGQKLQLFVMDADPMTEDSDQTKTAAVCHGCRSDDRGFRPVGPGTYGDDQSGDCL